MRFNCPWNKREDWFLVKFLKVKKNGNEKLILHVFVWKLYTRLYLKITIITLMFHKKCFLVYSLSSHIRDNVSLWKKSLTSHSSNLWCFNKAKPWNLKTFLSNWKHTTYNTQVLVLIKQNFAIYYSMVLFLVWLFYNGLKFLSLYVY